MTREEALAAFGLTDAASPAVIGGAVEAALAEVRKRAGDASDATLRSKYETQIQHLETAAAILRGDQNAEIPFLEPHQATGHTADKQDFGSDAQSPRPDETQQSERFSPIAKALVGGLAAVLVLFALFQTTQKGKSDGQGSRVYWMGSHGAEISDSFKSGLTKAGVHIDFGIPSSIRDLSNYDVLIFEACGNFNWKALEIASSFMAHGGSLIIEGHKSCVASENFSSATFASLISERAGLAIDESDKVGENFSLPSAKSHPVLKGVNRYYSMRHDCLVVDGDKPITPLLRHGDDCITAAIGVKVGVALVLSDPFFGNSYEGEFAQKTQKDAFRSSDNVAFIRNALSWLTEESRHRRKPIREWRFPRFDRKKAKDRTQEVLPADVQDAVLDARQATRQAVRSLISLYPLLQNNQNWSKKDGAVLRFSTWSDGDESNPCIVNWEGQFNGYGTINRSCEGLQEYLYLGGVKNGVPEAVGAEHFVGFGRYAGQYRDGERSGYGALWSDDGELVFAGLWSKNAPLRSLVSEPES